MEIMIYREPENVSLITTEKDLKEYHELLKELGLNFHEDTTKTPNVYVCLNKAMQRQLKALCPVSVDVEDYKRTTIPIEVLKVLKYSKENEMFDGYWIWYDDKTPDPLLIGWKWQNEEAKKKCYTWQKENYLIARWGDCKKELDELCVLGFERIKTELKDKASEALSVCNEIIKNPDLYVRKILSDGRINIDLNTSSSSII